MNIYKYTFVTECPSDGDKIIYTLIIESVSVIMAEHIKTACALIKKGFHEPIADSLHSQFGGKQTITAIHAGVEITTIRE